MQNGSTPSNRRDRFIIKSFCCSKKLCLAKPWPYFSFGIITTKKNSQRIVTEGDRHRRRRRAFLGLAFSNFTGKYSAPQVRHFFFWIFEPLQTVLDTFPSAAANKKSPTTRPKQPGPNRLDRTTTVENVRPYPTSRLSKIRTKLNRLPEMADASGKE